MAGPIFGDTGADQAIVRSLPPCLYGGLLSAYGIRKGLLLFCPSLGVPGIALGRIRIRNSRKLQAPIRIVVFLANKLSVVIITGNIVFPNRSICVTIIHSNLRLYFHWYHTTFVWFHFLICHTLNCRSSNNLLYHMT